MGSESCVWNLDFAIHLDICLILWLNLKSKSKVYLKKTGTTITILEIKQKIPG